MVKSLSAVTMVVHAAKHPNVSRRSYGTLAEGEGSQTIPHEGFRQENKGGNPEYLNQQEYGSNECLKKLKWKRYTPNVKSRVKK